MTVIQGSTGDYCFDNLALARGNDFLKHSDKVFSKVLNAIDGLLAEDQSKLFKLSLKIAIVFSFILRLYLAWNGDLTVLTFLCKKQDNDQK